MTAEAEEYLDKFNDLQREFGAIEISFDGLIQTITGFALLREEALEKASADGWVFKPYPISNWFGPTNEKTLTTSELIKKYWPLNAN